METLQVTLLRRTPVSSP